MSKLKKPSRFTTKVAYARYIRQPNINWDCPHCARVNEEYAAPEEFSGGCTGHGPDEYCYCPMREWRKHCACDGCGKSSEVVIS